MRKQEIEIELRENPNLERALATQLVAMGYIVSKSIPLFQQLDAIPVRVLESLIDGITDTVKSAPRASVGLIGGIFNLTEDIFVGALNIARAPGYPEMESYGQYCRRTKQRPRSTRSKNGGRPRSKKYNYRQSLNNSRRRKAY